MRTRRHGRRASISSDCARDPAPGNATGTFTLEASGGGFIVTMPLKLKGGKTERWHIRQDALLWKE